MLRVLGPLVVDGPDEPVPVGGRIPRRILCALLVRPAAVVPVDALVQAAWGDEPPASAERTLASHVARLRDTLAHADAGAAVRLERRDAGYRLVVAPEDVDATRFEQNVRRAEELPPDDAVLVLRDALALWRPPAPFADLQDTAYPAAEASRLTELHGAAVEALVASHLEAGDAVAAAGDAEARLRNDPYRERLWELLVLALYRQGRQGDALEAFRRARAELADGLGIDPGPRLRELEEQVLAQDPRLLPVPPRTRRPCPYKGLARYDAGDADLFVGRERLVDELVGRLVDEPLLVVVGPSGAGKSSLVRAGLVPALAAGALPGSQSWAVAVVVPGAEPLRVLSEALAEGPSVLVVDQAEEALLAEDGRFLGPFGDRLLAAVVAGTRIVLVLRADFFGLLAAHPGLARRAGPATVLVGPPDEQELRRIVLEPAARVGLRVEPELADLAVADVRDRPGALPVLSTALVRAWEHRAGDTLTVASYRSGGGVAAALERVGEEAWASLDDEEQRAACRRLLLRLAGNEDGAWIRRWVRRMDLVRPDDAAAAAALAVLTGRRLVVARAEDIGIAHEALLTGWPRLRGWLEDAGARVAVLEHLADAARAWEQSGRDPAEVYRGTRLQAALDVAAAEPDDLTPLEHAFLDASAKAAERQLDEQRARADREARGRRRARLAAGVLAVALAFAASAGGYAITQQRTATRAAVTADASRLGALARSGGAYDRSLLLAAQAVALDPSPASESDLFATLLRGDAVVATMRAAGQARAIAFAPDSRSILGVTATGDVVRWPVEGGAATTVGRLAQIPGEFAYNGVLGVGAQIAAAGDGHIVLGASARPGESSVQVLDPSTLRVLQEVPANVVVGWALANDHQTVVAAGGNIGARGSNVRIWRAGAGAPHVRDVPTGGTVAGIASCGTDLACVLTDRQLLRVRLSDGVVERRLPLPADTVDTRQPELTERLVSSADGRLLAIVTPQGTLRVLDAGTGEVVRELTGASGDLHALAFSPDGNRVAAADHSSVLVWPTHGSGRPERHEVHGGRVGAGEWSPDGATLATLGRDGAVVVLDTTGRRHVGAVLTEALTRTTTLWATRDAVVAGQVDGRLLFVDPASGDVQVASERPHGTKAIDSARTGLTGDFLVTVDYQGGTGVWDLRTRRYLGGIDLPGDWEVFETGAWVSPDGRSAATIHDWSGPVIFDVAARRVVRQLPPLPAPPSGAAQAPLEIGVEGWTPDGRSMLITRTLSTTTSDLLVVDATTGAVRLRVDTKDSLPQEVVADPKGRYLVVGTSTGSLLVLDAEDGHLLAPPLQANEGAVANVSVSPDGRYIAASGQPPRLTVWDTRTFRQVAVPLPLDLNAVDARARFAPDGRLVVATGRVLRAFVVDPAQWLARACREAGRVLTREEFEEVLPGRPYTPACA